MQVSDYKKRWSRFFLIDNIGEYFKNVSGIDDTSSWEFERKVRLKPKGILDTQTCIYRDDFHRKIEIGNGNDLIWVKYEGGLPSDEDAIRYEITFKRIFQAEMCSDDLFSFAGYQFIGTNGKDAVEKTLSGIIRYLQAEKMADVDMERDAFIYKNCVNMLKEIMELTIYKMNNFAEDFENEPKETGIPLGLPFSNFEICNRLFWGGYQGSTNTREKLRQMCVFDDKRVEINPDIFELEEWE